NTVPNPAPHNEHARAARNNTYQHEISATTRPSRKSSRKSPGRIKTDASLRLRAMNRNASPAQRSAARSSRKYPDLAARLRAGRDVHEAVAEGGAVRCA